MAKVKLNPRLGAIDRVEIGGETYEHGKTYTGPNGWEEMLTRHGGFSYPTFVSASSSGRGAVENDHRNATTGEVVTANVGTEPTEEPKGSGRRR